MLQMFVVFYVTHNLPLTISLGSQLFIPYTEKDIERKLGAQLMCFFVVHHTS